VVLACNASSQTQSSSRHRNAIGGFFCLPHSSSRNGVEMTWKFYIAATEQRRMFSRILQILESQMVIIHSFKAETTEEEVSVAFVCSSEEDKKHRIEALIYRLEDVKEVVAE